MSEQYPSQEVIDAVQALVSKFSQEEVHEACFMTREYLAQEEWEAKLMEKARKRRESKTSPVTQTLFVGVRDANGYLKSLTGR